MKNYEDCYQKFIPWISKSLILPGSLHEIEDPKGIIKGSFDGETKIGFSAVNFAYVSKVTYETPSVVISEAGESRIFEGLYSHWTIKRIEDDVCEIHYKIRMTFANPVYT